MKQFIKFKNIFYEDILIKLKEIKEYKINMFFSLLITFIRAVLIFVVVDVLFYNFNDLLNWELREYVFFVIFSSVIMSFTDIFYAGVRLQSYILRGEMNKYLIRPVSVFFQYFLSSSRVRPFFTAIVFVGLLFVYLLVEYAYLSFVKLVFIVLYCFFLDVTTVLIHRLIDSFAWFMKNYFYREGYKDIRRIIDRFPGTMFEESFLKLGYIFPNIFYGAVATEFLFGYIDLVFFVKLTLPIVIVMIACVLGIKVLWHYGLKRYEAFG